MDESKQGAQPAKPRNASFGASMKAVFWSFLGIRKRSDYESDSTNLNPLHVIIAALIGVLLFIGVLITLVKVAIAQ
jgi:amino acid transporter